MGAPYYSVAESYPQTGIKSIEIDNQTVTTLATCWNITRKDGVVMGFTDFSKNIVYGNVTYQAKTGYASTTIESSNGLSADDMEIEGALSSEAITEEDIIAGKYDYAEIMVFQIDYMNLAAEKNILRTGVLGNTIRGDNSFTAELRGLGQLAQRNIGELYSESCRAKFCDSRCGLNMLNYTFTGTVIAVSSDSFTISASGTNKSAGFFTRGTVAFTSGENNGIIMEIVGHIKNGASDVLTPFLPLPAAIAVGDTMKVIAGCDGLFATCKTFGNYLNFRGEPGIPGVDLIYCYPVN